MLRHGELDYLDEAKNHERDSSRPDRWRRDDKRLPTREREPGEEVRRAPEEPRRERRARDLTKWSGAREPQNKEDAGPLQKSGITFDGHKCSNVAHGP